MGSLKPAPTPRTSCLPTWWFTRYLSVFALFTTATGVLVLSGVEPGLALAAPPALSAAAIGVMRWLTTTFTAGLPASEAIASEP
ncbi:hypothetical protein ACFXHA_43350 [Nocardia sp. NPDC059240]|uniref:hypothetical protein n=1 Tax=Nocardia sp. NPDC059240 TaxID=3346786 RepID=UPI0036887580